MVKKNRWRGNRVFNHGRASTGPRCDPQLRRCEMTGVTSDVHLVVYGDGSGTVAKLLGSEPRFVLQKVTQLSVPVTVLSLAAVSQLETAKKLPLKSSAAGTLREWFRQNFESAWEKLQRENARKQGVSSLGPDGGELPLGEAQTSSRHCRNACIAPGPPGSLRDSAHGSVPPRSSICAQCCRRNNATVEGNSKKQRCPLLSGSPLSPHFLTGHRAIYACRASPIANR